MPPPSPSSSLGSCSATIRLSPLPLFIAAPVQLTTFDWSSGRLDLSVPMLVCSYCSPFHLCFVGTLSSALVSHQKQKPLSFQPNLNLQLQPRSIHTQRTSESTAKRNSIPKPHSSFVEVFVIFPTLKRKETGSGQG